MTRITKAFQKWNESVNWFAQKDPDLTIFQVQENNVSHWYISRSVIRASWRTQLMNGLSLINQTLFALSSFMLCVCFNIVFKSCNNVKSGKSRRNQSLGNSFHLLCQRRISSSKHPEKKGITLSFKSREYRAICRFPLSAVNITKHRNHKGKTAVWLECFHLISWLGCANSSIQEHMSVNLSSLSFKSDSSVSYSFRYLETAAQERQPQKKIVKIAGLFLLISWFFPTIIFFRNVSLLQCRAPVFAEKILIWCRRWWKSFVFLPRDVSSQSCQKLPFHVKLLPRGSLSNLMFKLYIVQLRDKYLKMITLLIDQNWLWIKFPRASLISEFLGNIFVGIWAQNWIWSKTFPSSIFCDSPSMDPWPRALCRNKGFFNYSLSQAPKFNLALTFGSRICAAATDEIYRSRALPW